MTARTAAPTVSGVLPVRRKLPLIGLVIVAISILVAVQLVPPVVIASDVLQLVAGDLLDIGPLPEDEPLPENSYIYAADGSRLAEINFNENRELVTLDEVPEFLQQAVIATEDAEFYDHHGINMQAILRAGLTNVRAGEVEGGGSTITQQYVKNTYLADRATERTLDRKVVEAVWAVELEKRLSKDEILERYLSRIYFGAGAYGVAAAAERYYSKDVDALTLPEAATLAGIIRDPRRNDPLVNPDAARDRRDIVLDQMAVQGFISDQERDVARATPLETTPSEMPPPNEPFWVDWITRQLTNEDVARAVGPGAVEPLELMGETTEDRIAAVFQGGLHIHTTLDPAFQSAAHDAIRSHLTYEDEPAAEAAREPMAGIVSVEPGTGAVRTMAIGPFAYGSCVEEDQWAATADDGTLLCTKTKVNPLVPGGGGSGRQPGSSFKPFVITTALEAGIPPEWTTPSHSGQVLDGCGEDDYAPNNAGGEGTWDMYEGVKRSVNVFHAKLARLVGPPNVQDMAERLGLKTWSATHTVGGADCSIGLGATDVTPLEMAVANATLANRGEYCAPYAIERIETRNGEAIYEHTVDCDQAVEPAVADRVVEIMEGPVTSYGTAGFMSDRLSPHPVRGKTGTTDDSRDAWFVGYVKQLATAAWIGYPNGEQQFETADQAAAACPLFHDGLGPDDDPSNPIDYDDDAPRCPATTRLMENVTIGGQWYSHVYGSTIPAPMWADYMAEALQRFDPAEFDDPEPQPQTTTPNLVAAGSVAAAAERAEEAELNFVEQTVTHWLPAGTIVGQSPRAGASIDVGGAVLLNISDGRGRRPVVPQTIGKPQPEAISIIEAAGYVPFLLTRPTRNPAEVGVVLSQTPAAGTETTPGTEVTLVIGVPGEPAPTESEPTGTPTPDPTSTTDPDPTKIPTPEPTPTEDGDGGGNGG